MASEANVNKLWTTLREAIDEGMSKYVPHKMCKPRNGLPYITSVIKKLARKRDRVYNQMKKTEQNVFNHNRASRLKEKHKDLKHRLQLEMRRAYWNYVDSVITPLDTEEKGSTKRFWSFIKHTKKDNIGVSTLKEDGSPWQTPNKRLMP